MCSGCCGGWFNECRGHCGFRHQRAGDTSCVSAATSAAAGSAGRSGERQATYPSGRISEAPDGARSKAERKSFRNTSGSVGVAWLGTASSAVLPSGLATICSIGVSSVSLFVPIIGGETGVPKPLGLAPMCRHVRSIFNVSRASTAGESRRRQCTCDRG